VVVIKYWVVEVCQAHVGVGGALVKDGLRSVFHDLFLLCVRVGPRKILGLTQLTWKSDMWECLCCQGMTTTTASAERKFFLDEN
jgi:hypothetical protein